MAQKTLSRIGLAVWLYCLPYLLAAETEPANLFFPDGPVAGRGHSRPTAIIQPVAAFSASTTSVCPGDSVLFTDLSTNSTSRQWFFPGGTPSSSIDSLVWVHYNTPGTYDVTLVAINGLFTDTLTQTGFITVNPVYQDTLVTAICSGDSLFAGGAWQTTAGTYYDTFQTVHGCDSIWVTVLGINPVPAADAGPDQVTCQGDSILLGGMPSASGGTPPYTYQWMPPAGLSSPTDSNPMAAPDTTTQYVLLVTDANGCFSMDTVIVLVNPKPIVFAGNDTTVCAQATVVLGGNPTAQGGTPPYNYEWLPPTWLNVNVIPNPISNPLANITYTVVVTDAAGCMGADSISIKVNPNPAADAGNDKEICPGDTVSLGGKPVGSGGTPPYTYLWSPSTGLSDTTAEHPNAFPSATTLYTVIVTDSMGCTALDIMVLTVNPQPTANAGPDQTVCPGSSVTIGGQPTGLGGTPPFTYNWSPDTGLNNSFVANPQASPTVTTNYTVTVTDSKGCTNTDTVLVEVLPAPSADAGPDTGVCPGGSIMIGGNPAGSGGTPPFSYLWSPATGLSAANVPNPAAGPATETTYTLSITDQNGCTASDSVLVVIYTEPVANAGTSDTVCAGQATILGGNPTASGGQPPYSYQWMPASGLNDPTLANPSASPGTTTNYTVIVTDAHNCQASAQVTITVNSNPTADAGPVRDLCLGDSVQIGGNPTASGGAAPYYYLWAPPAGLNNPQGANPMAGPATTTLYQLTVIDANGCQDTASVRVRVRPLPVANAGTDTAVCFGTTLTVGGNPTASGGTPPYGYSWTPQSGQQDTLTVTASATTTYTVTVTDSFGCQAQDFVTVTVYPLPNVTAGPDLHLCQDDSVTLHVQPAGNPLYQYQWTPATGLSDPASPDPVASPASTITYTVWMTDDNGCSNTDTLTLNVHPLPVADAGPDAAICPGDSILIGGNPTASGGTAPYSYVWLPVSGLNQANLPNPIASPDSSMVYQLFVVDSMGCTDTSSMRLQVYDVPVVSVGTGIPDTVCIQGGTISLPPGTPAGGTYSGKGVSGNTFDPAVADAGPHYIVYTYIDINGCVLADSVRIYVDLCTGIGLPPGMESFKLFPNPSSGSFTVEFLLDKPVSLNLSLSNALGQVVWQDGRNGLYAPGPHRVFIQTGNLPAGTYYLRLQTLGKSLHRKLMILH